MKVKRWLLLTGPLLTILWQSSCAFTKDLGSSSSVSNDPQKPVASAEWLTHLGLSGQTTLLETPNPLGHPDFVQAINQAHRSIKMVMFHLTYAPDADALVAAHARGVDVRIILDGSSIRQTPETYRPLADKLQSAGVQVRLSSPQFSITHEKAMVLDDDLAFITSINLTSSFAETRDFGVVTEDRGVIEEWNQVFEADWINALNGGSTTPPLCNPNLVWSPINAESKLGDLILSAHDTIDLDVENIGEPVIQSALISASNRGVKVRVITPLCDKNPDPQFNVPFLRDLSVHGIQARVMPSPSTPATPYIHAKMIAVDGRIAYLGSINFTRNSILHAREVGIVIGDSNIVGEIESTFSKDWQAAVTIPDPLPTGCPKIRL